MNGSRLGYRPALDGIRGVAVLLVMIGHVFPTLIAAGAVGVLIFFTLSGFLITTLLIEERETSGRMDLTAFYKRRALRLLPALLTMLTVLLVMQAMFGSQAGYGRPALFATFYLANWAIIDGVDFHHVNHTWSLSIEEHFYLFWPLTLVLVGRAWNARKLLWLALFVAAASWAWRVWLWSSDASLPRVMYGTDARLDALLIGCALAIVGWQGIRRVPIPVILAAFAGIVSLMLVRTNAFHFAIGYTAVSVATVVLIAAVLTGQRMSSVLSGRPIVATGRISYGLYLWHLPVYGAVFKFGTQLPHALQMVAAVGLSFAAAALSYRFVEQPFLRLKRRKSEPAASASLHRSQEERLQGAAQLSAVTLSHSDWYGSRPQR
jgi:peptidoglycan/LPS O-acetylase OafA/YrhL